MDGLPRYIDPPQGASKFPSNYFKQGIAINDHNWEKLVKAARDNNIWLEFGFAQVIGDSIYMGQALIDSAGKVIQVRQKLRPSGGERTIFSDGKLEGFGRIGMLECWEHMHPTMAFPVQAQLENIHIAAFPWAPDLDVDSSVTRAEVNLAAARYYTVTGGAYVIMPAVGTAAVFSPNGSVVASIQASDDAYSRPLLYCSLDASAFVVQNCTYDWNEYSWSALQQINDAYPSYIPKTESKLISHRENSIKQMQKTGPIPLSYKFQF